MVRTVVPVQRLWPGLVLVSGGVAVAWALNSVVRSVSALMFALVLGAIVANTGLATERLNPGIRFSGRRLLRLGIVLLGLRLSIMDMLGLGWTVLAVVVVSVAVTFLATLWFAARIGLQRGRALLIATGFSICGASAVAAMSAVAETDEEDVMSTVALVTIYGSAAIFLLPMLAVPFGLAGETFGIWAGASVHEVAQVVATASAAGTAALASAVVVKLTRVVLLAPLVAVVAVLQRRSARADASPSARPPLVPLFVIGFLGAVCLRSTNLLPTAVLSLAEIAQTSLLAAGMFGLGASVRVRSLMRASGPSLAAGLFATVGIAAVSLAGILIVA